MLGITLSIYVRVFLSEFRWVYPLTQRYSGRATTEKRLHYAWKSRALFEAQSILGSVYSRLSLLESSSIRSKYQRKNLELNCPVPDNKCKTVLPEHSFHWKILAETFSNFSIKFSTQKFLFFAKPQGSSPSAQVALAIEKFSMKTHLGRWRSHKVYAINRSTKEH